MCFSAQPKVSPNSFEMDQTNGKHSGICCFSFICFSLHLRILAAAFTQGDIKSAKLQSKRWLLEKFDIKKFKGQDMTALIIFHGENAD